ncbi:MAG TPA: DUF3376 domain-containing protein, partial [Nocardioidaceae bacterium]|nr:DUF3376 domain-containing protein [Nocardioidaceae bacterium]
YTAVPKDAGCTRDQEVRASIQAAAEAFTSFLTPHRVAAQDLIEFTLAIEVVSAALAWGSSSEGDAPRFRYRQVTPAARSVVDLGRTVKDPRWLSRKLYGQRWGHFGAFASEEGRNLDWLWGRLDGASALCDYLMTAPDGTPLVDDEREAERLRLAVTEAILEAEASILESYKSKAKPEENEVEALKAALRTAAAEALAAEPEDLLLSMKQAERREAVRLLWRQATSLLEANGASPQRVTLVQLIRAFADPSWSKSDIPHGLGFKGRLTLHAARAYGTLARRIGGKKVKGALRI